MFKRNSYSNKQVIKHFLEHLTNASLAQGQSTSLVN